MKRLIIATIALLMALGASGQQALNSGAPVVSPQINGDNSVTFRLVAPKAVRVQVAGDFLPAEGVDKADVPLMADMTEKDGVWEYTTKPLASELYSYSFIVDGLQILDPNNVYINRDVASVMNIFITGNGQGDYYKVNDVRHGTVSKVWYDSPTLGTTRRMTIYTPPGYDEGKKTRYPVFYLLHGAGGDEDAWMVLGRTSQIMDNLIAQGKAEPMIVVMTNGNAGEFSAPGEGPDGFRAPTFRQKGMMDGAFEMSFCDVINYVERNFRVYKDKKHRAVAGLSMGGYHSMHISKYYPDTFDYVGLFSAAARFHENSQSPVYQNEMEQIARQFKNAPKLYWIAIGNTDFLYEENVKLREHFDKMGYPYVYHESEEGHIWRNWRKYLTMFVPQLFK